MRVWRLSPLGVELVGEEAGSFAKGAAIDLEVVISGQRPLRRVGGGCGSGGGSEPDYRNSPVKKVSLEAQFGDRRSGDRWLCSDEFLPTCVARRLVVSTISSIFRFAIYPLMAFS